jgi:hypothetical protein
MAVTLQTYITQVQRLLHDPNANFWPITELTDYINEARNRVASDSKCLRQLVTSISLLPQTDNYNVAATLAGFNVIDIMGIDLYYGNARYRLDYLAFTRLDAYGRTYVNNYNRPAVWSKVGANLVYFAPNPDQAYVTDWDVALYPNPMILTTDTEVIPYPFFDSVKYWAAFLAKFKEQQLGESKIFEDRYKIEMMRACRSFLQRVIPRPYNTN